MYRIYRWGGMFPVNIKPGDSWFTHYVVKDNRVIFSIYKIGGVLKSNSIYDTEAWDEEWRFYKAVDTLTELIIELPELLTA